MNPKKILFTLLAFCVPFLPAIADEWYTETLFDNWRQVIKMEKTLYQKRTPFQDLIIFENALLGRVLALDGVIQTTEADEYVYHEMLAHVPILAHGNVKNVLIIGGGDGGMLREVTRHKGIEKVVLVEIDASVIELSKIYLPSLSKGAFEDPRVKVVIQDGAEFVQKSEQKFDVIIIDSTDPIGPGKALFTAQFFSDCKKALEKNGILVNQNGVPFVQGEELLETYHNRQGSFQEVSYYVAPVPTYVGGFMAFGWATDSTAHRQVSAKELQKRLKGVKGEMRYYTPDIHKASFALPRFIEKKLVSDKN